MAIECENVDILKAVLDHNPDKTALFNGDTALHYAIRKNKGKQALYLVGYDYPVDSLNRNKDTPVSLARNLQNQQILSIIENPVQIQKAAALKNLSTRESLKVTLFKDLPLDQQPASMKRTRQQKEDQMRQLQIDSPHTENDHPEQPKQQEIVQSEQSIQQESLNMPNQNLEQQNIPSNMPEQPVNPGFQPVGYPPNQNNIPYYMPNPAPQAFMPVPNQLVQRTDFSQLQKRVVIMEQILSQLLPKYSNQSLFQPKICAACNSKPGLNICPVCSNSFCQEDFYAHVAKGCKNL